MNEALRRGLKMAAAHIEIYGLHKRSSFADYNNQRTSAACLYGAIGLYCLHENDAIKAVATIIGTSAIAMWNDKRDTTQEMVVNALRKAASK